MSRRILTSIIPLLLTVACVHEEPCPDPATTEAGEGDTAETIACSDGEPGCPCIGFVGGACQEDSVCMADGFCWPCPTGELGCQCGANRTCDPGLKCDDPTGICVEP